MSEVNLTIQDLLFNDQPITINRKLAKCLGLKEAVIFQQIHYWLEINKRTKNNFKENRYWTYNSIKNWHENEFDFLSLRTVERTLKSLEKDGLLICKTFNKMAGDKTKWYSIDYEKLLDVCEKKLGIKKEKSKKMSKNGKLGAIAKKEKNNTIQPNWQNGDPSNQIGGMVQPNWQNGTAKLAEAIPEITTKTSTEISLCSSSNKKEKTKEDLFNELLEMYAEHFGKDGKLAKSRIKKLNTHFENVNYNFEFVKAIIEYAINQDARTHTYFDNTFNKLLDQGIATVEDFEKSIKEHYEKNNKKSASNFSPNANKKVKKNSKAPNFTSMPSRDYNYDILEKRLLGWSDEEVAEHYGITVEEVRENSQPTF